MEVPPGPVWLRWRLHAQEHRVLLHGPDAVLFARAQTVALASTASARRSLAGFALRQLIPGVERLGEHYDWVVEDVAGEVFLRAVREAAPRGVRSPLDAAYAVSRDGQRIGTIGRAGPGQRRPLQLAEQSLVYTPEGSSKDELAARAQVFTDSGTVIASVLRGQDQQALPYAPADGLVTPLDSLLLPSDGCPSEVVWLCLLAALLDTQVRDVTASANPGYRPRPSAPPMGTSAREARRAERARSSIARHNQHLDDLQRIARQRGDDALAERLEARRRTELG